MSRSPHTSPRLPNALLERLCEPALYEELRGDLEELYEDRLARRGKGWADLCYTGDVLLCLRHRILRKHSVYQAARGPIMWKNYLTIAFRNIKKYKGYAFINITGLAVGVACCLLMLLYIQDELSYDRFHTNADRIYRVVNSNSDDEQPTNANGSYSAGPALEKDFPEVEHAVRFVKMGWGEQQVFTRGVNRFYEPKYFFADAAVFDVFSFPFVSGDPGTALVEPNTIVLTETTARKYFGDEDPIGQTLSGDPYNEGRFVDFRVTGVMQDVPARSHMQFDFLISYASLPGPPAGWGWNAVFTYVLLAENASPDAVTARLPAFQESYMGEDPWYSMGLQPLLDIRLHSHLRAELEPNGDIAYVYLFAAIALFILLVACINFMNLATARSAQRAREVGMRKVLGAHRFQLIKQFLSEALLLSFISMLLALLLVKILLPPFNAVAGKAVEMHYLENGPMLLGLIGLMVVIGLIAGSYPAFFLSTFRPVEVLKGKLGIGGRSATGLRKGLVVFQFAVCIMLFACTAVVYNQMDYIRSMNLGFERDQIIVMPLNDAVRQNYTAFRNEMMRDARVHSVALSEQVPARSGNGAGYRIEGVDLGDADWFETTRLFVDHHFNETYGIEIIAGRDFSPSFPADSQHAFIINEALVHGLGWSTPEEAVGKEIEMAWAGRNPSGQIIGVVKNFHLSSLRDSLSGVVLNVMPMQDLNFISIRMNAASVNETLAYIEQTWSGMVTAYPFEFYFLDEDFARLHRADQRLGQVFGYFALLAILVACLGLFGLASFTAERRTKEIGVRKVMGATVGGIVMLLSRDFGKLVLIAMVFSIPLAYVAMQRWLEGFAYRVEISGWIFLVVGLTALLMAILTVGYQSIKAALANPVEALRYE